MGETVEIQSNGDKIAGYLATPDNGTGYGVMVIQEWWGLVPQIKRTCDRLAEEGFVALAPDLYRGQIAEHTEMDKAGQLMSTLPPERAAADMEGAVDYLRALASVQNDRIGVIGYCMGGMLAMLIGAKLGDKIGAVVPHYGAPLGDNEPDWSNLSAPIRGHFAENDDFFPPQAVKALETKLRDMGKDVHLDVYPGTSHAFCNEENALGTHDERATKQAWRSSVGFLKNELS